MEEQLSAFTTDTTIANEEYKNIIVNNVTIDKIKAYYYYILEEYHQFLVDFNEDLSEQEAI